MNIIQSVGKGIADAATSPLRSLQHGAQAIGNAAQVIGDVVTLDKAGVKQNLKEMGKDMKDCVFAGAEALAVYGTLGMGAAGAAGAKVAGTAVAGTAGKAALAEAGKSVGKTAVLEGSVGGLQSAAWDGAKDVGARFLGRHQTDTAVAG